MHKYTVSGSGRFAVRRWWLFSNLIGLASADVLESNEMPRKSRLFAWVGLSGAPEPQSTYSS